MENKENLVRKIAQRVLKRYKLAPPIDVKEIIRKRGIQYSEENLGTNADGYSDLRDSELKIIVNSQIEYEPRKIFTIAHELGHIFISWHDDITLCMTDNEFVEHNMLDIQEREANVFASELLMPTKWVEDILKEIGQDNMRKLVETLTDRAKTSIMASFYALENAMESGHVFFVSGHSPFVKKFIAGNFKGFNLYGYDLQEAYEYVADKKEHFSIGYYEVFHYILPRCPSDNTIRNAFLEKNKIIEVFEKIFGHDYSAWIVWAEKIINMLPQIYVGFLYQNENLLRCYRNENSEVVLNYREKTSLIQDCDTFGYVYESVSVDDGIYMIFIKEPSYQMPTKRKYHGDSRTLIKMILSDLYYDAKSISNASYRINGIIGSALSHKSDMSTPNIYNLLQKKLRRLDLVDFVEDERFNEFVFIKAIEKGI